MTRPSAVTVQRTVLCAASLLAAATGAGCAALAPPFDTMKESQMTVYRLQNFEPQTAPPAAQTSGTPAFQLPPQIQQWITAGASLLPAGLLPPGLLPGSPPPAAPVAQDAPRFHGFRILEWQPVNDAGVKGDIAALFGHASNFQPQNSNCLFAEFGFALAQTTSTTPADVLVSLSCADVQAFNFNWPHSQTGVTPDAAKKVASIAQRVFQGR